MRWMQDVTYALRQVRRAPGFTLIAILVLALGIGANTAIFSVLDAVVLKPLPLPNSSQLVEIKDGPGQPMSGPNFQDIKRRSGSFQSLTLYTFSSGVNLSAAGGGARPVHVALVHTEANFFDVLGVQPLLGRGFARGDDRPGRAGNVAVLSYGLWKTAFAGRPGIVGRNVELDGASAAVIGVMPPGFAFPAGAQAWLPQDMSAKGLGARNLHQFMAVGRLRTGVTPGAALADLQVVQAALDREHPRTNTGINVWLEPLQTWVVGQAAERGLLMALFAVGLVLLIACANVSNLLLARAAARQREMAVRAALGASRLRLVRQLLTESVLLALAGGTLGLGLAWAGVRALMAMKAAVPQPNPIGISPVVLAFTLALALLTGLLFGLAPAWQISRPETNDVLKDRSGANLSAGRRRRWLSDALVVGEAALSLALLVAAGLLLRSVVKLETLQFGARRRGVLTAEVDLPATSYKTSQAADAFAHAWLQKVRSLPGVESAAITSMLPLRGGNNGIITLYGHPTNRYYGRDAGWVEIHGITPGYLRTFRIPLLEGRRLNAQDQTRAMPSMAVFLSRANPAAPKTQALLRGQVIPCEVNQTMARRFWPGKDPVGQKFSYIGAHGPWWQVVGVVADTRQWGLRVGPRPEEFQPWDNGLGGPYLVVHAGVPSATLTAPVRRALAAVNPDLVLFHVRTMRQVVAQLTTSQRFMSELIGIFAGLALLLAAVGLYGVMSYLVSQRTREVGIRMALGAGRGRVLGEIVGRGMRLAGLGIALGVAGSLAAGRLLASFLYGVKPTDWLSLTSAAAALALAALAACWLPGLRAARVDPAVALRRP